LPCFRFSTPTYNVGFHQLPIARGAAFIRVSLIVVVYQEGLAWR
jgi:hypothetical protein